MNLTFIKKPMKNKVNAEKKIEKTANHIICAILPPKLYKLLKKTALDIIFTRNCKG